MREPMANDKQVACVGPVKYIGQDIVKRDIENFKAALKGVKVEEAFMPVVAPSSVLPDRKDEYYKSEEEWLTAMTEAMRVEYKMIVDAGFVLQIDDARSPPPMTAWFRPDHRGLPPLARKIRRVAQRRSRRYPRRAYPLPRLLGKLARPACERRPLRDIVDLILKVRPAPM